MSNIKGFWWRFLVDGRFVGVEIVTWSIIISHPTVQIVLQFRKCYIWLADYPKQGRSLIERMSGLEADRKWFASETES